jgi:hypothetical protein
VVTEQLYRYEIWGQFDNMIGRFTTSKGAGYLVGFDQLGERVIFLKITNESDNKSWQVFRVNATGSTKFHLKDGTPMVILRHTTPTGHVGSAAGNLGTVGLTPGMLAPGFATSSILVEGEYAPVFNRFRALVTENALIIPEFVFEGPKSHRSRPRPKF